MMDLLQKVRQEYAGERIQVSITIEDLNELINRKAGLSILTAETAEDLFTQIQAELAELAKLRHEYLSRNPHVEIEKVPREDDGPEIGFN